MPRRPRSSSVVHSSRFNQTFGPRFLPSLYISQGPRPESRVPSLSLVPQVLEALGGRLLQHLAVVRVRNVSRPVVGTSKVRLGNAIFSHNVVGQRPRRHDPGARLQRRDDARDALVGPGGEREDGLALRVERGAAQEVHLPADARVDGGADRVGDDLALWEVGR